MRATGLGAWDSTQPVDHAPQVEGGCGQNVLQVGFSEADVARPTYTERVDGLRQDAFDAGAHGVAFSKIIGLLPVQLTSTTASRRTIPVAIAAGLSQARTIYRMEAAEWQRTW